MARLDLTCSFTPIVRSGEKLYLSVFFSLSLRATLAQDFEIAKQDLGARADNLINQWALRIPNAHHAIANGFDDIPVFLSSISSRDYSVTAIVLREISSPDSTSVAQQESRADRITRDIQEDGALYDHVVNLKVQFFKEHPSIQTEPVHTTRLNNRFEAIFLSILGRRREV